jgi:hypothetical protein
MVLRRSAIALIERDQISVRKSNYDLKSNYGLKKDQTKDQSEPVGNQDSEWSG